LAVKNRIKQELKSVDKKSKSNSDDEEMGLSAIDIELIKLNYKDIKNMVLDHRDN